jgi:hypothetical protein
MLGQRRHRDGGRIPIRLAVDRRAQPLEALRQFGAVAFVGALEQQLSRRAAPCPRVPGDHTRAPASTKHGDGRERKFADRRDDDLETVLEATTLETRKVV